MGSHGRVGTGEATGRGSETRSQLSRSWEAGERDGGVRKGRDFVRSEQRERPQPDRGELCRS